jgi:uncharacterized protein (TIGR02284 family)
MTTSTLSNETVGYLQDLVEINVDSQKGFDHAAAELKDPAVASFFRQLSQTRAQNASELKPYVTAAGKNPHDSGSTLGAAHRWWIDLKGKLTTEDTHSILEEAEKGEDSIKHLYEKALKDVGTSEVATIIQRQYQGVKQGHDQVKALRDRYRNPA